MSYLEDILRPLEAHEAGGSKIDSNWIEILSIFDLVKPPRTLKNHWFSLGFSHIFENCEKGKIDLKIVDFEGILAPSSGHVGSYWDPLGTIFGVWRPN